MSFLGWYVCRDCERDFTNKPLTRGGPAGALCQSGVHHAHRLHARLFTFRTAPACDWCRSNWTTRGRIVKVGEANVCLPCLERL